MDPSYWSSEEPEDVVSLAEGYNTLETGERILARQVNEEHARPVHLWYEGLNLYRRAMTGDQVTRKDLEPPIVLLRTQLQAQGVASAKAALDMLMAGYYNVAFAAIRQLMDIYIQCHYLVIRPEDARYWPTALRGARIGADPPSCRSMITDLKRFAARTGDIHFPSESSWQHLFDRWRVLGAWTFAPPVDAYEEEEQEWDENYESRFEGGPRHDPDLLTMGFFYGLITLDSLFTTFSEDGRFAAGDQDDHARYHAELEAWTISLRDDQSDRSDREDLDEDASNGVDG